MDAWNLPQEIVSSLRFQNDASYDGQHALYANLCYITKRLLATKQIGDIPVQTIPVELYQRLQLDPSSTEEVMAEVMAASMEIEAMTAAIGV